MSKRRRKKHQKLATEVKIRRNSLNLPTKMGRSKKMGRAGVGCRLCLRFEIVVGFRFEVRVGLEVRVRFRGSGYWSSLLLATTQPEQ